MSGKEVLLLAVWRCKGSHDVVQIISTAAEGNHTGMALQHSTPAGQVDASVVDLCLNLAQHIYRLYRQLTMQPNSGEELSCLLTAAAYLLCHADEG